MVDRDGWELATVRVGPPDCRRTLLALHGGPGLSHESLRSLDALAGPKRCVLYFDQRGNGGSGSPGGFWTETDLVADVEAVRQAWGLRRVDVLGHSWGAYLAVAYARDHKRRVRHLVLSSPAPLTRKGWTRFTRGMRDRIRSLRAEGRIPPEGDTRGDDCAESSGAVLPAYLFDPAFQPAEERAVTCSRATYHRTWAALPMEDLAALARDNRKRALWIQGEGEVTRDGIRDEWERYHRGRLRIVEIPQCGHVLHTECPDRWLDVVEDGL